jgi:heme A synthase
MSLIGLVVVLVVIGVVLWLVNTQIPMDAKIKTIINVVVLLVVLLWLLGVFGVLDETDIRVPKIR